MASLRAFLREPLAGFLLIGALFFALHGALREDVSPVTLSSAGRAALYADFRALMGREPTDAERAALVREYTIATRCCIAKRCARTWHASTPRCAAC
jgi:hypothetical protein